MILCAAQSLPSLLPLIPPPDQAGLVHNAFQPSGNKFITPKTLFVRVDQAFGNNFNMSTSVNANTRPSLRQCASFSQGCNFTSPSTYFGEGFFQDITTRTVHQQFNWIIKPNLFNHTTLSFDRWVLPANPVSAGQHWVSRLGLIGPIVDTGGAPRVDFSRSQWRQRYSPIIPYSHYGESDTVAEGCIANRWQFLDDVTWVKGKHTLKAGFEYRHHQFPTIGNSNTTGTYNFSNRGNRRLGLDRQPVDSNRRSGRLVPAGTGGQCQFQRQLPPPGERAIHFSLDQRRIQSHQEPDPDPRIAL